MVWPQAERIADEFNITMETIPVWPVEVTEEDDPNWEKRVRYSISDAARMAEFYDMALQGTEPMSLDAARKMACIAEGARESENGNIVITAGLGAVWRAGENFDNIEALRAVCTETEISWEQAEKWIESVDIKRRLQESRALLLKLGHYDTATFEFNGTWYWGADRIEFLEDDLTAKGLKK